jgi:homoserine dehydrogenase
MPQTLAQWVIAVIGTGGVGKFAWDLFTARSQNKKNNSDVTVNLVNSATGYADSLTRRIDSINARFDEFRQQVEDKEDARDERDRERDRRDRRQAQLLLDHSRWDHRVTSALRELGRPVEEAPPLFISEGNDL